MRRERRSAWRWPTTPRRIPDVDNRHLGPLDVCNGHSVAFSGIKFDPEETALDLKLVEGGEGEELLIATFDLDALRAYRASGSGR